MKLPFKVAVATKYLGLLLIVIGIPVLIIDPSATSEMPLLVGLYVLFISKEAREDERAVLIKTSSAYIALVLGYGIKLISTNLYSHQLIPVQLTEINHFLILVFAFAIIIYYSRLYLTFNKPSS
jgi:hypothetical protein